MFNAALTDNFRLASSRFSSEDLDDQRSDDQESKQFNQDRPKVSINISNIDKTIIYINSIQFCVVII